MIISDLNHLEIVSKTQNIEGGFSFKLASPTTQSNVSIMGQTATSFAGGLFSSYSSAGNGAYVSQFNVA